MEKKMVKVLAADDFYTDWILYETTDPDRLREKLAAMINDRDDGQEEPGRVLYSSTDGDAPDLDEVRNMADQVVYTSELYDDDNDDKYLPF